MKHAFLDTLYGQAYYVVEGSGDPVILLHRNPRSLNQYTEVIPILTGEKWVIAMDNLNYGDSDKPSRQLSIVNHGETVARGSEGDT